MVGPRGILLDLPREKRLLVGGRRLELGARVLRLLRKAARTMAPSSSSSAALQGMSKESKVSMQNIGQKFQNHIRWEREEFPCWPPAFQMDWALANPPPLLPSLVLPPPSLVPYRCPSLPSRPGSSLARRCGCWLRNRLARREMRAPRRTGALPRGVAGRRGGPRTPPSACLGRSAQREAERVWV